METNDYADDVHEDVIVETADDEGNDTTDWKAIAMKNQGIAQRLKTKLAKQGEKPTQDPKKEEKSGDSDGLLAKAYLRSAGITKKEEVELALLTAKKWGVGIDELVDDEDFQGKLEKMRTKQANIQASTGVSGDKTGSSVKETTEYWVAKGTPPTPDQVPNRATRSKIISEMLKLSETSGKKFYND